MRNLLMLLSFMLLPARIFAQSETVYLDRNGDECSRSEAKYTRTATLEKDGRYKMEKRLVDGSKTLVVLWHVLTPDTQSYDGVYERYAEDGRKECTGSYINNEHRGLWKYYYDGTELLWYTIDYDKNELYNYYRSGKIKRHEVHTSFMGVTDNILSGQGYDEAGKEIPFMPFMVLPRCPYNLIQYLSQNIRYPSYSRIHDEQGRVVVEFTVYEDGSINDVEVVKHVSRRLDKEARRVVAAMPRWIPGTMDGKISKVYFKQPIKFELED